MSPCHIRSLAAILTVLCCALSFAQVGPAPRKIDFTQPQSPRLPAPEGLTLVDVGASDKRLAGYRAPEGIKVEIVADAPTLVHPVALGFNDDGTPCVLESPGTKAKDAVKVLSSSKPDGPWDQARTVFEGDRLSNILLSDGFLYVAGQDSVRRYKQSKPAGPFDTKTVVAHGFSQVSGLTLGTDGWLYISAGEGDHHVKGSDASQATVLRTGAIFRSRPDGSKIHPFALGFINPRRDVAFDLAGHLFAVDDDLDKAGKFTGCRLLHIPEAADFGWRLQPGARGGIPDPARAAAFGEKPGKMPPLLKTGPGSPSGLLIYNDSRLPEEFRGRLFYPDAERRLIRAYKVEPYGSSFRVVEEFEFLSGGKDDRFRPSHMTVGPDGGIYIVDSRRIYRVSWAGTRERPALPLRGMDSWAKIGKLKDEELIKALSSEEASERERVRRELVRRGERNRPALIKLLKDDDTLLVAKVMALGALQAMYNDDVQNAFVDTLAEGDGELQRLAAEALGLLAKKGDRNAHNELLKALAIEDRAIRRSVALAMGRLAGPGAGDNLASALSFDDGKDVFLRDGYARALEMLGKPGIDALIALADSGTQKGTDRVVEVFRGLRSRVAFDALLPLLKNPHVSAQKRADLVRSCTNYQFDPPPSLEPIVGYLASQEKERTEVKKAMLEVLATPGTKKGTKAQDYVVSQLKDSTMREEAISLLGATAEGARQMGQLYLAGKLPMSLRKDVAEALRRHASKDAEVAKLIKDLLRER